MTNMPRENINMKNQRTVEYDTALYSGDGGMWTVIEIVKRPIAKVASEHAAKDLILRLKKADGAA